MFLFLLLLFVESVAIPLQQNSLITLRTLVAPKAAGGNQPPPSTYGPLILEEWDSSGLLQSWTPSCSLVGLSTETWTEGYLSPRYPLGDQVWFLCRNVPVNSSLSYNPAPVSYMYLTEDGFLNKCVEDFVYPNGTNLLNIVPYTDMAQGLDVFYLLGGGTTANGPTSPARAAQPRIRVDSGFCAPADTEGSLLGFSQGVTINQLRILDGTLYGTGLFVSSTGIPQPTIFQIGAEGVLPLGTRNPTSNIVFPLVLSSWTDPLSSIWWRTGINRTAYVALYNNSDSTDKVFALPPSSSAGTLGGAGWSVVTARQEGLDLAVYLTNTSHIVKNTLNGLQQGLAYQPVVQAPSGWRYLSAHARNPSTGTTPTPSATPTASASTSATATTTSTSSPSASATATATTTATTTATATATTTATTTATATATATATTTTSSSSTSSASATPNPQPNPNTPSPSPSNATIPIPANAATSSSGLTPGETTGVSLGVVGAFCVAGLLLLRYSPTVKNLYTRQFGSSFKGKAKQTTVRKSPLSDVPITINHNPNVLVLQRLEQLRNLQKEKSKKELDTNEPSYMPQDRTKKQFNPVVTINA